MKKILLLFVILIYAVSLNAQNKYFNLTPHWLVSVQDTNKNYVVVTMDSCSAEQMYKKTINYINKSYKNPDAVIRGKSENEFLTFITYSTIFTFEDGWGITNVVSGEYFTTISYKNNKIKISFFDINMKSSGVNFDLIGSVMWSKFFVYYKSDLTLFKPDRKAKEKIELFFNNKVNEIISGINKSDTKSESW